MPYSLNPEVKTETASYAVFESVLSNEECKAIIALSEQIPADDAKTGSNPDKRISEVRWIHWQAGVDSLFAKLATTVLTANSSWWNYNLSSFWEPLQLTHYRSELCGHYSWHTDRSDVGLSRNRKISGTLLLNDNYEGGEFELFDTPPIKGMKRGSLILFPSYAVHRVKPVTRGERWSLVFWVSGPPFV